MNHSLVHNQLALWYEREHRVLPWRETLDPYLIWISEIILQQTRVDQGMGYYMRFVSRFPDVQSLSMASEDEVLRYWQGLGYYSRARNLHKAAKKIAARGYWMNASHDREELFTFLLSLPGVGEYTAGAIASFAFDLPYPALDGNVYRVLSRLYDCEIPFDSTEGKKYFKRLGKELLDCNHPRLYNSAIMEFGALHCTPSSPDCIHCPIQSCCLAYAHGTVDLLPIRKPRPKLRDRYLNYTIFCTPDMQTLLHRRTEKDIWQHLYEFPLVESDSLFSVGANMPSVDLTHVLSHQRLHARFHIEKVDELPHIADTIVISLSDIDNYALSRLTLRALASIQLPL
jgi:A/G-specific adenine glycosylase